jgi:choline/carnitine/betaine transport
MNNKPDKKVFNHIIFWPAFLIPLAAIIVSFINNDKFISTMMSIYVNVTNGFGWSFMLLGLFSVVTVAILFFTPLGNIRFGGLESKPKYSFMQWFTMSLCGGIAIGIVFWGVAEPITYLAQPPLGIEGFTGEAAIFSLSQTFFHWSFVPYSFYAVCTIPIALAVYNLNMKVSISSGLYFLIGDKCNGPIGKIVDALALLSLVGGISTSMGQGIMQISSGLNVVTGLEVSPVMWAVVAIVTVVAFTFTSVIGIDKGLKWLADQNFKLYVAVLLFILIVGPTAFIMNLGTEALGEFITAFVYKSTNMGVKLDENWSQWWTIFYWAVWIAYAPVVGIFLTRLCYGRTIKQFILANVVGPAVFCIIWFTIVGGTAIEMQLSGAFDLWGSYQTGGLESSVFSFFSQFPLGKFLVFVFLIVISISFITMADSMTSVAAIMCTKGFQHEDGEPPMFLKILWGSIMGIMAWVMIASAGIDGTKMIGVIASFPLLLVVGAMAVASLKGAYLLTSGKIKTDSNKKSEKDDIALTE